MIKIKNTKRALLMSALALIVCFAMLVGSTFAWFTDSVTSSNNIIKSGNLKVGMYWAEGNLDPTAVTNWNDASQGAIFKEALWEPGYTEAKHIKIVNEGSLAIKYQMRILANGVVSMLADVIDVYYLDTAATLTRDNIASATKLGTLSQVLNNTYANAISATIAGNLEHDASKTVSIAFKMQESAGNEYQNLTIGSDFSIQLIATQYTSESDSFNNTYDANAEFAAQEAPKASVFAFSPEKLKGITIGSEGDPLDVGYSFQPTETYDQASTSEYFNAHADFFVYTDKTVPANSMALAGYYNAFNGMTIFGQTLSPTNWIALTSPVDVEAGKDNGLRLIADGMNGGSTSDGITVPYNAICLLGNDGTGFLCGASDLTGANSGTTLTVELRLYKTYEEGKCPADHNGHISANCETGEYITVGTFTYTFPEKTTELTAWELIDTVATDTTVSNKVANDYVEIMHKSGDLVISNSTFKNGLTIYNEVGSTGTVTLEKCTIYLSDGVPANTSYNMCKADYGMYVGAISSDVVWNFVDCTFTAAEGHTYASNSGYNIYIAPNYNAKSFTFEECTFEKSAKHGIGCSSDANATYYALTVKGCNFKDWNNNATNGAAIRGNLPAADFVADITISGNTFGNSNNSTQTTVAIDNWNGTWS